MKNHPQLSDFFYSHSFSKLRRAMTTPFLDMLITPARKLAPPGVKGPLNTANEKVPLKAIIGGKVC